MPFPSVTLKPGPGIIAAALYIAGFSDLVIMPPVTDACGKAWPAPSQLQTMIAIAGGEGSGHAWCWNINTNGSTDYGMWEINNAAHPQWFGPVTDPAQYNWANYAQNAEMAFAVFVAAQKTFKPWNAFNNGGYLADRYNGVSWMSWAKHGIDLFWAEFNALSETDLSSFEKFAQIASIDLDPLEW
jgi:Lysozyme like domain